MNSVGAIKNVDHDEKQLQELIRFVHHSQSFNIFHSLEYHSTKICHSRVFVSPLLETVSSWPMRFVSTYIQLISRYTQHVHGLLTTRHTTTRWVFEWHNWHNQRLLYTMLSDWLQYESHLNAAYNGNGVSGLTSDRRLLIKVVKGEGLTHANDPYCVIEMDEPAQKNQTGARQGKNPLWDEHFLLLVIQLGYCCCTSLQ